MKMSALSAPGWFVAVMLLHCGLLLVFVGGYTVGKNVCAQASSGRLLGP